ncbi:MAG: MltA domain-containing protein [Alphaproteobacteria bacterium]|nr:MAG: MltA domain-containing protein [Alphaproteobacteria bacterium]
MKALSGTALAVMAALMLTACTSVEPEEASRVPVAFADLPGWYRDGTSAVLPALRRSCAPRRLVLTEEICAALDDMPDQVDDTQIRAFFEHYFQPYALIGSGNGANGLFTGYYEPEVTGSFRPDATAATPLYRLPPKTPGEAMPSRAEIFQGALEDQDLELAYLDDPVAAFFLEIQGSGVLRLRDGRTRRLAYAGQNGHPYVPIGRILADAQEIPRSEVSLFTIHAWLRANPLKAQDLMNSNPSYVFFRLLEPGAEGPIGAQGVPLTAGRSLAVDRRYTPYGTPVWLDADPPLAGMPRVQRLMMAQDTGGAIRGVVRGDVFWGTGEEAGQIAGAMKSRGRIYQLLPKN